MMLGSVGGHGYILAIRHTVDGESAHVSRGVRSVAEAGVVVDVDTWRGAVIHNRAWGIRPTCREGLRGIWIVDTPAHVIRVFQCLKNHRDDYFGRRSCRGLD